MGDQMIDRGWGSRSPWALGIPATGHVLSPLVPMATLREAAGLTKAAMARARGVTPPTIDDSEAAGGGVSVATLAKAAEALGGRLELRYVPPT